MGKVTETDAFSSGKTVIVSILRKSQFEKIKVAHIFFRVKRYPSSPTLISSSMSVAVNAVMVSLRRFLFHRLKTNEYFRNGRSFG